MRTMRTWILEKAEVQDDGTPGQWQVSLVGGTPEIWHSYDVAVSSAEKRTEIELDGCYWRVADDN